MIAALAPLMCVAACGFSAHAVPAAGTDPTITGYRPAQPHRVWAPQGGGRRQLLLHFPGSDGGTGGSNLLAEQMARDGFHVINLGVRPGRGPGALRLPARVPTHPSCALDFRGERFYIAMLGRSYGPPTPTGRIR